MHPEVRIPQRCDDPPSLLLWSMDEVLPAVFGLLLGMLVDQILIFSIAGIVISKLYSRYRDQTPDGYLMHVVYHLGLYPSQARTMINPFIKRLYPV